ncbi:hypothetical protein [Marinimicrobium alkaliphilum]|uniref:hypothetical protein n=1 Tax=Marinimicrobium alkaliphilum TaxID=2202654 RepID=UPI000DBA5E51|nr:hypothetical protein [Marinimicrobium alkaliphilum]
MRQPGQNLLIAAAFFTALAALAHIGCIVFGAEWYRFFGAGEEMARMAEAGHWYPAAVTAAIVALLLIWSLYALSGAGVIRRLPFLRLALCLIAAIFLVRGVAFVGLMPAFPENSLTFWLVSSSICLVLGALYAFGTYHKWTALSGNSAPTPKNLN